MIRSHLYLRAKRGKRDELLDALDRLEVLSAVKGEPGLLAVEVQLPFGDEDHLLVEGSWSSRDHYERWHDSTAWADLLRAIEDLLADDPRPEVYHVVDVIG